MSQWVVVAGAIEDVSELSKQLDTVLKQSVLSLACTAFVIWTWWKTKRAGATFIAAIAAAAIWYAVMNMAIFRDKLGEDLAQGAVTAPATVAAEADDKARPGEGGTP